MPKINKRIVRSLHETIKFSYNTTKSQPPHSVANITHRQC
jgi:hypothetical protein